MCRWQRGILENRTSLVPTNLNRHVDGLVESPPLLLGISLNEHHHDIARTIFAGRRGPPPRIRTRFDQPAGGTASGARMSHIHWTDQTLYPVMLQQSATPAQCNSRTVRRFTRRLTVPLRSHCIRAATFHRLLYWSSCKLFLKCRVAVLCESAADRVPEAANRRENPPAIDRRA